MTKSGKKNLKELSFLVSLGDCIQQDVDGFYYFVPDSRSGIFSAYHLRVIAEELDRRNLEYNKQIEEYLEKHNV